MMLATVRAVEAAVIWRPTASAYPSGVAYWTRKPQNATGNLHLNVNEEVPEDSQYICLQVYQASYRAAIFKFDGPALPATINQVKFRFRISNTLSNGSPATDGFRFLVKIGGTTYYNEPITATWTTHELTIPGGDVASWDLSGYFLTIEATGETNTRKPSLSWMELEFN